MLAIRFQRIGRKKSPSYRLVISENARDTQGRALEILGHYNPVANPKIVELKTDRIKHWLDLGAQASESVNNLLVREGVVEGTKQKSVTISKKRQGKIDVKKTAVEEAKKAKEAAAAEARVAEEEAKKVAAEEAKAEAESPTVEEVPAVEDVKEDAPTEAEKAVE